MMSNMKTVNLKVNRKCAFCVHWYDPTNSAIQPVSPRSNIWKYDEKAKCMCMKKKYDTPASSFCGEYECKV